MQGGVNYNGSTLLTGGINVNTTGNIQALNVQVTENGERTITPPEGVDGYAPITIDTNVPTPEPVLDTLNVTSNGTYTPPSGVDGYDEVNVSVSGYTIKTLSTTPTSIASFTDGTANPLKSLTASIVPVQAGSGDPSPTNVRPISGWTEEVITVADDTTTPTVEQTYTIPFTDGQGQSVEVYYGNIDIVKGTLTDISDNNEKIVIDGVNEKVSGLWGATNNGCAVYKSMPVPRPKSVDVMCDKFKYSLQGYSDMPLYSYVGGSGVNVNWTFVLPATVTTKEEADAWFAENPTTIVYKKTTPVTYQQQPTSIKSLDGVNNVSASTGEIEELIYFADL